MGIPEDEEVQIVGAEPDRSFYEFAGDVYGEGKSRDIAEAVQAARANLREAARERGATRVVLDTNNSDKSVWDRKTVVLVGRAFRKKRTPSPTP